jgi:hypothetical protein
MVGEKRLADLNVMWCLHVCPKRRLLHVSQRGHWARRCRMPSAPQSTTMRTMNPLTDAMALLAALQRI